MKNIPLDPFQVKRLRTTKNGTFTYYSLPEQEILEAIWVAAEMRPGGSYAHSALAIEEMGEMVKQL